MIYEDLDIFQTAHPTKVFDLQGGTVNLPEVLKMLESFHFSRFTCRCDYETAEALHKWIRNTAVVSTGIADDKSDWLYYHMVGYPFSIWVGRFQHKEGNPRRMEFDGIGMLVNFQPTFEWLPEYMKLPFMKT